MTAAARDDTQPEGGQVVVVPCSVKPSTRYGPCVLPKGHGGLHRWQNADRLSRRSLSPAQRAVVRRVLDDPNAPTAAARQDP